MESLSIIVSSLKFHFAHLKIKHFEKRTIVYRCEIELHPQFGKHKRECYNERALF